jgi:small ligand-binding sensory domain FIST
MFEEESQMPSRVAVSTLHDTRTAAHELADRLEAARGPDLSTAMLLVASFHHRAALPEAFDLLRGTYRPQAAVAVTTVGVVGGGRLHEGMPALAILLLDEPGLEAAAIAITPDLGPPAAWSATRCGEVFGGGLETGFEDDSGPRRSSRVRTVLWADPFSSDPPGLAAAGAGRLVHGGVLSGSSQAGGNTLISATLDQPARVAAEGAVGLALRGARATAIAQSGARPIGRSHVVTAADGSRLIGLGGRPVLDVLRETLESTGEAPPLDAEAPMGGLAIGIAVDEHRPDGRDPICRLRPMTGIAPPPRGSPPGTPPGLRLAEPIRPGRTVRFHLRDARWASEALQSRLDEQAIDLATAPAALVAISAAREIADPLGGDAEGVHPAEFGGAMGIGLRTAGEFVDLGGHSELDTLSTSTLVFEGPPSLA